MKTFLFILCFFFLPFTGHAADSVVPIEGPIGDGYFQHIHTITPIGDYLFFIDHVAQSTGGEKRLYRLPKTTQQDFSTAELVFTAPGTKHTTDRLYQYQDTIYLTITGKRGEQVIVYRSLDNGTTWTEATRLGSLDPNTNNTVADIFSDNDRLYVAMNTDQATQAGREKKVLLWNTVDGTTWTKQTLDIHNPSYVGSTMIDGDPYIVANVHIDDSTQHDRYGSALFTATRDAAKRFRQISLLNYHSRLPIRNAQQVIRFQQALFVRGYIAARHRDSSFLDKPSNYRTLRSVNGVAWKPAGGKFSNFTLYNNTLFTQSKDAVYYTTDGITLTPVTFSFMNAYTIAPGSLYIHGSQDQSILLADFSAVQEDGSTEKTCVASDDGVVWQQLDCVVPDKAAPQQIVHFGKFWYFVRGREQSSYKLYRLSL